MYDKDLSWITRDRHAMAKGHSTHFLDNYDTATWKHFT